VISTILIGFKVLPNDPSLAGTLTTVGVALGGVLAVLLNEEPISARFRAWKI
jgi:uncharacterized YccA/Bax inhibitor family protein